MASSAAAATATATPARVATRATIDAPGPSGVYTVGTAAAEARIRELTSQLEGGVVEAGIVYHARIGAIVVEHLYGGNLNAWRRRKSGDPSLRQLADRLKESIHPSSLYRALSIYELLIRHAPAIPLIRTLGVRALASIARAPVESQAAILERALQERWACTQVEAYVSSLPRGSKGGRPRKPVLVRGLTKLTQIAQTIEHPKLEELDIHTLRQCLDTANAVASDLDRLVRRLEEEVRAMEAKLVSHVKRV